LEDLLPQGFVDAFVSDNGDCAPRVKTVKDKVHRDFSRDGKAKFHRFARQNAVRDDLLEVIAVIKALRFYLNLK
jgi:hypothetical protein